MNLFLEKRMKLFQRNDENKPARVIHFEGWCPFLTCLRACPHTHYICEVCGAVRYGNLGCDNCRANRHKEREPE